jgi:hypothetical protein
MTRKGKGGGDKKGYSPREERVVRREEGGGTLRSLG